MSHLWFVENRAQAEWIRDCPQEVASCHVVAQTAEALQALEEFGVNHVAVAEYADTRLIADQSKKFQSECFALINEVEDYILSNYDDVGKSVKQTIDGGYIVSGGTRSYGDGTWGSWKAWLIKTDSEGNVEE